METVMDKVVVEVTVITGLTVTSWILKSATEPALLRQPHPRLVRLIITTTVATVTISKICTVRRKLKRAAVPPWWCQHAITITISTSQAAIQERVSACTRQYLLRRLNNYSYQARWRCKWAGKPLSPSINNIGPTPTVVTSITTNEAFVWDEDYRENESMKSLNLKMKWCPDSA